MKKIVHTIPRTVIGSDLEISQLITGLWQVADQERAGTLDISESAGALEPYVRAGADTFDMADHYGSAELIAGEARRQLAGRAEPRIFTKWCPPPGPMTTDVVRSGVTERLNRLGVSCIDLLQFHWWTFEHPAYLDALHELSRLREEGVIRHIGLTNWNTDHLHLVLHEGIPIATNQVCISMLDQRALGAMSDLCLAHGVKLLAYGTVAGGFISERWLGKPEPEANTIADWSKMKYARFIETAGGWDAFQNMLDALATVAQRHDASLTNVATRWVLDHPAVAGVIVGARLNERVHLEDNRAMFGLQLNRDDQKLLDDASAALTPLPGDCGDEYRRPPFLTASGDLSHHLEAVPNPFVARAMPGRPERLQIDTGSEYEPLCGYSRAVRIGNRILVSGTTATHGVSDVVGKGDPRGQAVFILDRIIAAIAALGGAREDIVRTRIYLANADDWEAVSLVHGRYLGDVRPANTLLEISRLVGDYLVEIEAEAVVD